MVQLQYIISGISCTQNVEKSKNDGEIGRKRKKTDEINEFFPEIIVCSLNNVFFQSQQKAASYGIMNCNYHQKEFSSIYDALTSVFPLDMLTIYIFFAY